MFATFENGARLELEMAKSIWQKALGLMFRRSLPENRGMIFVFDQDAQASFWMLFTFIPLEAIFLDAQGRIVDIVPMKPHTLGPYKPKEPAKYVIEANTGFCVRNSIKAGMRVGF